MDKIYQCEWKRCREKYG